MAGLGSPEVSFVSVLPATPKATRAGSQCHDLGTPNCSSRGSNSAGGNSSASASSRVSSCTDTSQYAASSPLATGSPTTSCTSPSGPRPTVSQQGRRRCIMDCLPQPPATPSNGFRGGVVRRATVPGRNTGPLSPTRHSSSQVPPSPSQQPQQPPQQPTSCPAYAPAEAAAGSSSTADSTTRVITLSPAVALPPLLLPPSPTPGAGSVITWQGDGLGDVASPVRPGSVNSIHPQLLMLPLQETGTPGSPQFYWQQAPGPPGSRGGAGLVPTRRMTGGAALQRWESDPAPCRPGTSQVLLQFQGPQPPASYSFSRMLGTLDMNSVPTAGHTGSTGAAASSSPSFSGASCPGVGAAGSETGSLRASTTPRPVFLGVAADQVGMAPLASHAAAPGILAMMPVGSRSASTAAGSPSCMGAACQLLISPRSTLPPSRPQGILGMLPAPLPAGHVAPSGPMHPNSHAATSQQQGCGHVMHEADAADRSSGYSADYRASYGRNLADVDGSYDAVAAGHHKHRRRRKHHADAGLDDPAQAWQGIPQPGLQLPDSGDDDTPKPGRRHHSQRLHAGTSSGPDSGRHGGHSDRGRGDSTSRSHAHARHGKRTRTFLHGSMQLLEASSMWKQPLWVDLFTGVILKKRHDIRHLFHLLDADPCLGWQAPGTLGGPQPCGALQTSTASNPVSAPASLAAHPPASTTAVTSLDKQLGSGPGRPAPRAVNDGVPRTTGSGRGASSIVQGASGGVQGAQGHPQQQKAHAKHPARSTRGPGEAHQPRQQQSASHHATKGSDGSDTQNSSSGSSSDDNEASDGYSDSDGHSGGSSRSSSSGSGSSDSGSWSGSEGSAGPGTDSDRSSGRDTGSEGEDDSDDDCEDDDSGSDSDAGSDGSGSGSDAGSDRRSPFLNQYKNQQNSGQPQAHSPRRKQPPTAAAVPVSRLGLTLSTGAGVVMVVAGRGSGRSTPMRKNLGSGGQGQAARVAGSSANPSAGHGSACSASTPALVPRLSLPPAASAQTHSNSNSSSNNLPPKSAFAKKVSDAGKGVVVQGLRSSGSGTGLMCAGGPSVPQAATLSPRSSLGSTVLQSVPVGASAPGRLTVAMLAGSSSYSGNSGLMASAIAVASKAGLPQQGSLQRR